MILLNPRRVGMTVISLLGLATACSVSVDVRNGLVPERDAGWPDGSAEASADAGADSSPAPACNEIIEVRALADVSGPTKSMGVSYLAGEQDYFRELNEAGGIKGCRINFVFADYGYKADSA